MIALQIFGLLIYLGHLSKKKMYQALYIRIKAIKFKKVALLSKVIRTSRANSLSKVLRISFVNRLKKASIKQMETKKCIQSCKTTQIFSNESILRRMNLLER